MKRMRLLFKNLYAKHAFIFRINAYPEKDVMIMEYHHPPSDIINIAAHSKIFSLIFSSIPTLLLTNYPTLLVWFFSLNFFFVRKQNCCWLKRSEKRTQEFCIILYCDASYILNNTSVDDKTAGDIKEDDTTWCEKYATSLHCFYPYWRDDVDTTFTLVFKKEN